MKRFGALITVSFLALMSEVLADTRIYDVDPAYRREVVEILSELLDVGHSDYGGRVELLPTGQIVVDTYSDERQNQVAMLLDAIASHEPEPTPTIRLRYWLLHGVRDEDDARGLPPVLDDVIREIEDVHGDLGFEVLDAATVSSRSGEGAVLENDRWEIYQETYANGEGDRLNAKLTIEHQLQELDIELALTKGEFVVLGSGTSGQIVDGGVLALIVNWPADD